MVDTDPLGDQGVLALVCDSTNVNRDGISPSEAAISTGRVNRASAWRTGMDSRITSARPLYQPIPST